MEPRRVVITGGPGTGKTSIVDFLEASGFVCFHEIIRTMTSEAKKKGNPATFKSNPLAFVSDPLTFNRKILDCRIAHFRQGASISGRVVFYDRGIPDVLAYMDYFNQEYDHSFEDACKHHRYDAVFLLPPWEAIYVSDEERLENFKEAQEIHRHLETTYRRFGYDPITVTIGAVADRAATIKETLKLDP